MTRLFSIGVNSPITADITVNSIRTIISISANELGRSFGDIATMVFSEVKKDMPKDGQYVHGRYNKEMENEAGGKEKLADAVEIADGQIAKAIKKQKKKIMRTLRGAERHVLTILQKAKRDYKISSMTLSSLAAELAKIRMSGSKDNYSLMTAEPTVKKLQDYGLVKREKIKGEKSVRITDKGLLFDVFKDECEQTVYFYEELA